VDYDYILPHVDLFISNGGYGSVLLSLSHGVPVLAAGLHEGKNEINARIGYFNLGINMKTEWPKPARIARNVETLLTDATYRQNVQKLQAEFNAYNPFALVEQYIDAGKPVSSEPKISISLN
jgi:UDP:flavonoid glycosyltransferase YjiC (YdhE family)